MVRSITILPILSLVALMAMSLSGCGGDSERFKSVSNTISGSAPDASLTAPMSPRSAADKPNPLPANEPKATVGRKIIYNSNISLVTEDLNAFESNLSKVISKEKAYVADSGRTGAAGATRHGMWKVRVPADSHDEFVALVLKLGELVSIKANSQDVSEEFYDLDARQAAKKVEETRLLKHLTDSTGKLDEILAVEKELSRVRSEIERMQGRLRVIGDLTTLATVTINANEVKDYIPPQAPTLGLKISRTFAQSVESLEQFGEGILLMLVALAPWLPLLLIGGLITYWIIRKAIQFSGPAPRRPLPHAPMPQILD